MHIVSFIDFFVDDFFIDRMQDTMDFDGMRRDFREVDVSRLTWRKMPRGAAASADNDKIMVQTPVARCRMEPAGSFTNGWVINLLFDDDDDVHAEFQTFLCELQSSCAAWGGLDDLCMSETVYRGYAGARFRLMAFSDALFFDANANQVPSPVGMEACSCVIQLQGAWATAERWGLRWKVVQVKKAAARPRPRPPPRQQQQHQQQECMFPLDDDE